MLVDFSKHSSLGLGISAEVKIFDREELGLDIDYKGLKELGLNYLGKFNFIGRGNNILVYRGEKLASLKGFDHILDLGNLIEIGANVKSRDMFKYFKEHNFIGAEFLAHLPGELGGLIKMNAGMKDYEISNMLHSCNINGKWVLKEELDFEYRALKTKGAILAARFLKIPGFSKNLEAICLKMRANQPGGKTCGSCFKNPKGNYAGKLLEDAGMKGFFVKGVGFSEKHANFLVNTGKETNPDIALEVIDLAKAKVFEKSGINLECELALL
ncbi:UDP-N-acetylenolpyruvoylglucosamine reductase [Helicobacter sp. 11S02629-2]|uniref:UDP-N-acetylenolpyruvoylglucosamine reductase n=1 Tax=Helicobacter sp. 11S02629-2 TaxID=1476195 RepID=UPI000BA58C44|nr:UDP-N-acetylenolpyruvoylglucosamine reductase [Helicobacter sp. 11S02629-2]PAF45648.1 hypothetical protein BKH40_01840 [Helicobacter sp. 11S02629-2]